MPTNIKQFDPNLTNLETDANYNTDPLRTGGAASGVFPKETFNKFAYQTSSFVAALAAALSAKGYTINDGSAGVPGDDYNALVTALANIMTPADKIPTAAVADEAVTVQKLEATATHGAVGPFGHSQTVLHVANFGPIAAGAKLHWYLYETNINTSINPANVDFHIRKQAGSTAVLSFVGLTGIVHSQVVEANNGLGGLILSGMFDVLEGGTCTLEVYADCYTAGTATISGGYFKVVLENN